MDVLMVPKICFDDIPRILWNYYSWNDSNIQHGNDIKTEVCLIFNNYYAKAIKRWNGDTLL